MSNKIELATTETISQNYAGKAADNFISAALLGASTIANGGVTVVTGVDYKYWLQKLDLSTDLVKNATCDFTDTSTITLGDKALIPEEFQVNLELCKKNYVPTWTSLQNGFGLRDNLAPSFSSYLVAQVAAQVATRNETNIWSGVNATAGQYDGFEVLTLADGDVVDVTGIAVTAANVIAELGKVEAAIPDSIRMEEDLNIYVPMNVWRHYITALGAADYHQGSYQDGKPAQLAFSGINLFLAKGMTASKMIAARSSNLHFVTNIGADMNDVATLDMKDKDGSDNVRIIMNWTAVVGYAYGAEIVRYSA
tara:strand:+ start:2974 stop:3900 length:927 start_codon:yes stop_codon:yes gene_type:complete